MANEIVWYDSSETGSPTLNNAAGSILAVLDACLVSGFRVQTLTSVTVAANVATATLAGHGYGTGRMVELSGAGTGAINGRKKITLTGANTFTFPAPGVADGAIGGVIVAKRSPLGWTKPAGLQGANKATYARSDPTATAMLLRVDDSVTGTQATNFARALLLESATDIDTYVAPTGQPAGGYYWGRGYTYDAAAKPWVLIGDGLTFYLFVDGYNTGGTGYSFSGAGGLTPCAFGDLASFRSGDAYRCAIAGPNQVPSNALYGMTYAAALGAAGSGGSTLAACRRADGVSSAVANLFLISEIAVSTYVGNSGPTYPSPVDNGLAIAATALVSENTAAFNYPVRGYLRGMKRPLANVGNVLHLRVLSGVVGAPGDVLCVATLAASGAAGCLMFDLAGPW